MKPASVIIMDEHPIVRMSIEVLLQKNKNITVKLKSGDSHEVLDCIRNHPIDLVILDIELTGSDAFALLKRIKNLNKDIKVLFLSSKSELFYAGRAIRAGANGFVSKRKDLGEIYNAVEMILMGYSFFPSETLNFINHMGSGKGELADMPLSNREVTVLRYLANGLSNKEIAEMLGEDEDRVTEIMSFSQDPVSMEAPVGDEDDSHLGDFVQDSNALSPEENAIAEMRNKQISLAMKDLTDREQEVITLRFGLDGNQPHTLEEVGQMFHVTRERIRQIEAKALRKLGAPSRKRMLRDFL